ncbi:MAG: hypothetical protein ACFFG0_41740 [Candidatus Thorarchaeota archaeon]
MSIVKNKIIQKIWDLAKKSFIDDLSLAKLRDIEKKLIDKLSNTIIVYIDSYNQSNDLREYYSFYRIYSIKGNYLFSLPGRLNLPESEWEEISQDIIEFPENQYKSRNGGDYHKGYRIYKLSHPNPKNIEMFMSVYSYALFSDYEDQCSDKPEIYFSYQELIDSLGIDINLEELERVK